MITHLEPDILECEVKWALGSITMNKASRDDEIPAELFQILKNVKVCTQYASKFGKLSSGHRTGKGQFSFQPQRRAVPKYVQITLVLCSLSILVRLHSKSSKLGFKLLLHVQAGLRKGKGTEIKLPAFVGS